MIQLHRRPKKSDGENMAKAAHRQQDIPDPITQGDVDGWLARLRNFLVCERKKIRPQGKKSPPRHTPSSYSQAAEEELLEAKIRCWLAGLEQRLVNVSRCNALRPAVVITTTPVGIRACEKLVGESELGAVFDYCCHLTEYEYRYWCKEEADINFQFHINYWAWIKTSVPSTRMHEFRDYPMLTVKCTGGMVRPRAYLPTIFMKVFPPCRGAYSQYILFHYTRWLLIT